MRNWRTCELLQVMMVLRMRAWGFEGVMIAWSVSIEVRLWRFR